MRSQAAAELVEARAPLGLPARIAAAGDGEPAPLARRDFISRRHAPAELAGDPALGATRAGHVARETARPIRDWRAAPEALRSQGRRQPAADRAPAATGERPPRATGHGRPATGNEQPPARGSRAPAPGHRPPATGNGTVAAGHRRPATDPWQQAANRRPTANHRPLTLDPSIGSPLNPRLRAQLEHRLGTDLGGVRIHTGESAARAARGMRAAAFTVGRHVFFGAGRFDPHSQAGLELIAHELTHVRQQPNGRPFLASELSPSRQALLEAEAGAGRTIVPPATTDERRPLAWTPLSLALAPAAGALSEAQPAVPMLAPEDTPGATAADAAATAAATGPDAAPPTPATRAAAAQAAAAAAPDTGALVNEVMRRLARSKRLDSERGGIQPWA